MRHEYTLPNLTNRLTVISKTVFIDQSSGFMKSSIPVELLTAHLRFRINLIDSWRSMRCFSQIIRIVSCYTNDMIHIY